jgi:hypothetical protein
MRESGGCACRSGCEATPRHAGGQGRGPRRSRRRGGLRSRAVAASLPAAPRDGALPSTVPRAALILLPLSPLIISLVAGVDNGPVGLFAVGT